MIDNSDIRERVIIHTLLSTGMRGGALSELKISDIEYLPEQKIYKFKPYSEDIEERYITFCTPECAKTFQTYLKYRESKFNETIKENSPYIAKNHISNKQFMSSESIQKILENHRYDAGVMLRTEGILENKGRTRKLVMRSHVFHKMFSTICITNNMNPTVKDINT